MTDRGSSWIGPAVVAATINNTGNIRLAFAYPLVMLLVPLPLMWMVDHAGAEKEAKQYALAHKTAGAAMRGTLSTVKSEESDTINSSNNINAKGLGGSAELLSAPTPIARESASPTALLSSSSSARRVEGVALVSADGNRNRNDDGM